MLKWVPYNFKEETKKRCAIFGSKEKPCCETSRQKATRLQREILAAVVSPEPVSGQKVTPPPPPGTLEVCDVPIGDNEILPVLKATCAEVRDVSGPALLAVHGLGGGLALWGLSIGPLTNSSPSGVAYFIDLPGFARCTRIDVPSSVDAEQSEQYFVSRLERCCKALGLDKIVLVGHSLGGYVSSCFALQHPERISRLILIDPWGLDIRTDEAVEQQKKRVPWIVSTAASCAEKSGPLFLLRAAGPLGAGLIPRFRPDLGGWLRHLFSGRVVEDYMFACNDQKPATGELYFMKLQLPYAWAARPLVPRFLQTPLNLPVHFIYGENTWMNSSTGAYISEQLPQATFHIVPDAGHQVFMENPFHFNDLVTSILTCK